MKLIRSASQMARFSQKEHALGKKIAIVPTMGALHKGHLSLVEAAKKHADVVIVSIFVNPTQFGPNEDYKKYPRTLEKDLKLLKSFEPIVVFAPSDKELYPKGFNTSIKIDPNLTRGLCGAFRPGHFEGVATIVAKLFNIAQPDSAFYGEKDFQQQLVIKKLAKDLDYNIKIISCPTVREPDGLAMSSRNAYLSPEERETAPLIYKALYAAKKEIQSGNTSAKKISSIIKTIFSSEFLIEIEYLEIVDANDLSPLEELRGKVLIAIAARLGKTRLIDNITVAA